MAVVTTVAAEERRQKRTLITLFSIVFLGLGFVVWDYFRIINITPLPENPSSYDMLVEQWKSEGFVKSLDMTKAVLVVNETQWDQRKRQQKVGIVTQLARYVAEKKGSQSWVLQVVGQGKGNVLAEIGNAGLRVN
ncbi:MAG: hypothetical protein HYY49_00650 [Ignavibacteriales bacterium]|nr:hypothetical protein [Ignavibacteriales bacterium]